jgi:hypothetical protein
VAQSEDHIIGQLISSREMQPSIGQSLSKGEEDHEIGCVIILICLYCNARKHLSKEERDRNQQSSHVVIPKPDGDYFSRSSR